MRPLFPVFSELKIVILDSVDLFDLVIALEESRGLLMLAISHVRTENRRKIGIDVQTDISDVPVF